MKAENITDQIDLVEFRLLPESNKRLLTVCGSMDEHLRLLEMRLGIEINNRGNAFSLTGDKENINLAREILQQLYLRAGDEVVSPEIVHLTLQEYAAGQLVDAKKLTPEIVIKTRRGLIRSRGLNQQQYLHQIMRNDINFGIGPAGTGKTYLAVAAAVDALDREQIRRILLVRPAVEAGEKLGFLPGDLAQKVDPYLRPLYDALFEMFGFERVNKLIERNVIEVAPLAYMRGRTLNDAFIILDEAQNTTPEQMKMFLTRIGFGSTAVITGDITQVDLPRGQRSGLQQVIEVLADIKGISFTFFTAKDVVHHTLVQKVVQAYDSFEKTQSNQHRK